MKARTVADKPPVSSSTMPRSHVRSETTIVEKTIAVVTM